MVKLFDRVKVNIATTGVGDIEFGSAASAAFLTPIEAGCADADEVRYVIVDGTDYEEGVGTIKSSVAEMERTTVTKSKIGGTSGTTKINLSGTAVLALVASAADILTPWDNLASLDDTDEALDNLEFTAVGKALAKALDKDTARSGLDALGVIRIQKFTASGTYTPDPNLIAAIIECYGGGGGGGSVGSTTGVAYVGGGGCAGGYSRTAAPVSAIGASQTVTIGGGGAGASSGNTAGGDGSPTSVGSLCVANGGPGGTAGGYSSTSTSGATPGTGDVAVTGAISPRAAGATSNTAVIILGGAGADSPVGSGGRSGAAAPSSLGAGLAAEGYASGGGGGAGSNSGTGAGGGDGAPGLVIITEFCSK